MLFFGLVTNSFANNWDPWDFRNGDGYVLSVTELDSGSAVTPWGEVASSAMLIYRNVISPINGKHCPMYPSCSSYAKEAIRSRGLFMGILLAFDRLHRCGHDLRFYEVVYVEGGMRFYDYPE